MSDDTFYSFEVPFMSYQSMLLCQIPRTDLVVSKAKVQKRPLEHKLTVIPDYVTSNDTGDYGCELVVRPDTIAYLSLSICNAFTNRKDALRDYLKSLDNFDWKQPANLCLVQTTLNKVLQDEVLCQSPLLIQTIWKTKGQSAVVEEDCLDVFVWSNFAFTRLFMGNLLEQNAKIDRHVRTMLWLAKMLHEYAIHGAFDYCEIIDKLTYQTKNDKAFAVNGMVTREFMRSNELTKPRITRNEIKNIILGGGQKLLNPERRFDASIVAMPGIFE